VNHFGFWIEIQNRQSAIQNRLSHTRLAARRGLPYNPGLRKTSMETSLHRQLKALYCAEASSQEVRIDGFRIDAVVRGRLIEIQQGSLGALRDKVRTLLDNYDVTVVKPLVARKLLVRRKKAGGAVLSTRYSPRRETVADVFSDLVHFVGVFPHPRLTLEVVLTLQEEHRAPARKRRWRGPDFKVLDRMLVGVESRVTLKDSQDLASFLPSTLAEVFSTAEIAREASMPRWLAQKMAYWLRKTGAIDVAGKRGNAWLYQRAAG